jgi:hypothetical protein
MESSESAKSGLAATVLETIAPPDVIAIRANIYPDGVVTREEAERLFRIDGAARGVCRDWRDFFVEAITDYIVHQEKPAGYISEENAEWLIRSISYDGIVESMTEIELLVTALEKATRSPPSLVAFALKQVAATVIDGRGPLSRSGDRIPGVIEKDEVELLRRILFAFGGDANVAITRAEAEMLMFLNEFSVEEMNDPSWNELYVKAMTNFVLCSSGYQAPAREEALKREEFLDRAGMDIGGFLARMVSGGASAIVEAYRPDDSEAIWAARNRHVQAMAEKAAAVDAGEAAWLAERLGRGGLLRDNERAMLSVIRDTATSVHPALQPLIDKVA